MATYSNCLHAEGERGAKSCHIQEMCFITRAPKSEVFSGELSLGPNKLCKLFLVLFVRAEHYVILILLAQ